MGRGCPGSAGFFWGLPPAGWARGAAGAFTLLILFRGGVLPFSLGAAAVLALLFAGLWLLVRWLGDMGRLTQKIRGASGGRSGPAPGAGRLVPLAGPAADLNALEEGIALRWKSGAGRTG